MMFTRVQSRCEFLFPSLIIPLICVLGLPIPVVHTSFLPAILLSPHVPTYTRKSEKEQNRHLHLVTYR
jgi:hypothetical protein